jgi:hypothetical protein
MSYQASNGTAEKAVRGSHSCAHRGISPAIPQADRNWACTKDAVSKPYRPQNASTQASNAVEVSIYAA